MRTSDLVNEIYDVVGKWRKCKDKADFVRVYNNNPIIIRECVSEKFLMVNNAGKKSQPHATRFNQLVKDDITRPHIKKSLFKRSDEFLMEIFYYKIFCKKGQQDKRDILKTAFQFITKKEWLAEEEKIIKKINHFKINPKSINSIKSIYLG